METVADAQRQDMLRQTQQVVDDGMVPRPRATQDLGQSFGCHLRTHIRSERRSQRFSEQLTNQIKEAETGDGTLAPRQLLELLLLLTSLFELSSPS